MTRRRALDCAVIGGGVAGLYAAWRLATAPDAAWRIGRPCVQLFEMSDRLGGRLHTVSVPDSGSNVELGAMRFWKGQSLLWSLLQQLEVPCEPFPGNGAVAGYYLRGSRLATRAITNPAKLPFRLGAKETGKKPTELLGIALAQLAKNPALLQRVGFWNALAGVLSNEAYQLLLLAVSEESAFSNWNAAEAVRLLNWIFTGLTRDGLSRPRHGWSALSGKLRASFEHNGGRAVLQRRLVSISQTCDAEGPLFELDFVSGTRPASAACVAELERFRARRVILALPKHALLDVQAASPFLNIPRLRHLFDAVEAVPAFKLYFAYDRPWWKDFAQNGESTVTDLPIRLVYYGLGVGGTRAENGRILLASYADYIPSLFWIPLVRYHPELWSRLRQQHASQGAERDPGENLPPMDLRPVIEQAVRQLQAAVPNVHRLPASALEPRWAIAMDWGAPPHHGGWHAWRAGVPAPEFIGKARQPLPGTPLFVCGEAYSVYQGWIEGALTSTERTLQHPEFGLSSPKWLEPRDYDLGP